MDRRPSDRVLEEWDSVTRNVQRPAEAPRHRGTFGAMGLVPLVAAALIVAVGIGWLGGREDRPAVGASQSPTTSQIAVAGSPSTEPSASPSPAPTEPATTPSPTPEPPSPTPEPASPTPEPCDINVAIMSWEGAAGSRIANLTARNHGSGDCVIPTVTPAQLIDGSGRVLAKTGSSLGGKSMTVGAGEAVRTMASVSNVCVDPVAPVTIRLDFGDGRVLTAQPASPDDTTVPPCNGPGQPSDMQIQEWTR